MRLKTMSFNPYMVTSIAPRAWLPVVFFHHNQYSSINCTLRPSICISCIFVAPHLQNKSSGIRTYIVLCCRMNDCPGINNFVKITVKYMARPICIGCCGRVAGETSLPLACALCVAGPSRNWVWFRSFYSFAFEWTIRRWLRKPIQTIYVIVGIMVLQHHRN